MAISIENELVLLEISRKLGYFMRNKFTCSHYKYCLITLSYEHNIMISFFTVKS